MSQVLFHALDFRSLLLSSRAARVGQRLEGEADKHAAAVTRNVRQVFQELASSKAACEFSTEDEEEGGRRRGSEGAR